MRQGATALSLESRSEYDLDFNFTYSLVLPPHHLLYFEPLLLLPHQLSFLYDTVLAPRITRSFQTLTSYGCGASSFILDSKIEPFTFSARQFRDILQSKSSIKDKQVSPCCLHQSKPSREGLTVTSRVCEPFLPHSQEALYYTFELPHSSTNLTQISPLILFPISALPLAVRTFISETYVNVTCTPDFKKHTCEP